MKAPKIMNNQVLFNPNDLTESDISKGVTKRHKFYEIKNNPNKIIRVESVNELLNKHNNKIKIQELIKVAKKSYKELEEKYKIIAPVDFFIGKNKEGEDVVFSVVERIKGKHFEEIEKSEKFISQVEQLYASVAKYFFNKFKEGGTYLWDINGQSQYVYGRKFNENEDKIYFIDTDIWLSKSHTDMYLSVYWLTRHMSGLEHRFNVQFLEARKYINEFINQPRPKEIDDAGNKNFDAIRKFLNNEKSDHDPKSAIPRFE